jgi:ABC-type sugar transport system ATPase subunit
MTEIVLKNVVKHYESLDPAPDPNRGPALNGVNLTIHDGETVSVVGPSGCGKSTLLKVVAGLEYPEQGQVLYNGYDVTEVKPQDRGVGMVFQDYALYPTRRGQGNLSYFFEVHKRTPAEEEERIKATAELMGVDFEWLLGRLPDTLSGGQKQRVAIARCIVRDPNIFLMDEPIVNLDAKLRERTRIEIKKLLRRFAITTLYVTHDQQEAIFMGDRIVVMRSGQIEQVGTFDELYYQPANLFVATFIGAPPIAIVPGAVQNEQISLGDHTWPLPDEIAAALPDGPVRVGVRPEGWLLDVEDGTALHLRHREQIPTERATYLHGTVAGAAATVLAPLEYRTGDPILVAPDWEQAIFFAAAGEEVLLAPSAPDLF